MALLMIIELWLAVIVIYYIEMEKMYYLILEVYFFSVKLESKKSLVQFDNFN